MMDADKRDSAVAYIEASRERLDLVRILEKKSEPLSIDYIQSRFSSLPVAEVSKLLTDLEEKGVISKMSDNPPTWDLSLFGREILYALEPVPSLYKFSPITALRKFIKAKKNPQNQKS